MSTHTVNVIEIESVEPHPNADLLEIVNVGMWSAVVKKGEFKPGSLGIYVEPDYMVPVTHPSFAFLKQKDNQTHARLKAKKIRGVISYGLLVPVPPEMSNFGPGVDVMGVLDIKRYDPELPSHNVKLGNMQALKVAEYPKVHNSKFDLENYQKYRSVIEHGQEVVITEKIDGTNARFTWYDGEMYAGSRNYWLKPDSVNVWNSMRTTSPEIVHFCARHPNHVLYGEIYGPVQTLKYGLDKPMFAAFAVHDGRWWMPYDEMKEVFKAYGIRKAPELCRGPWDESRMLEIAERDSIASHAPGQMMEGIVITTPRELSNRKIGRVALKYISKRFWLST